MKLGLGRDLTLGAALIAALCAGACKDEDSGGGDDHSDASAEDAGGRDSGSQGHDANSTNGDASETDAAEDQDSGVAPGEDAGETDGGSEDAGSDAGPADPLAPWALDCAHLPSGGACQGGPREVLLAMHETGLIAMFDPTDGHFLGWFKRSTAGGEHFFATQGPDQCIWTAVADDGYDYRDSPDGVESTRAIERWNTDGAFLNDVIRQDSKVVQDTDGIYRQVVDSPHSIAFTQDKVYVASTSGTPKPRIARFTLNGNFEAVVLEDGTEAEFLLVTNDGSLILSNGNDSYDVELLPAGGGPLVQLLGSVVAGQVAYAGAGKLLVAVDVDQSDTAVARPFRVDIATQMAEGVFAYPNESTNYRGIAPLKNGKWLITAGKWGVATLDPSSDPKGNVERVIVDDSATPHGYDFNYIGRACLSESFVAGRAPDADPPEASCDAPAGQALFSADFEDGNLDGFSERTHSGVTVSVDTIAASGTHSLKIDGGADWPHDPSGAFKAFDPGIKPSYIEYSLRVADNAKAAGYLSLNESLDTGYLDVANVTDGSFSTFSSADLTNLEPATWARIQLRNIDWKNRTYDLYVNCTRVANDIAFSPYGGPWLYRLELFNYTQDAVAWFDDIVVK